MTNIKHYIVNINLRLISKKIALMSNLKFLQINEIINKKNLIKTIIKF